MGSMESNLSIGWSADCLSTTRSQLNRLNWNRRNSDSIHQVRGRHALGRREPALRNLTAKTEPEVLALPGVGEATLKVIEEALKTRGLGLRVSQ